MNNLEVFSTRIRLARNFKHMKMPLKMKKEDFFIIEESLSEIIEKKMDNMFFIKLRDLAENDRNTLFEERRISKELLKNYDKSSLIMNKTKDIVIMINEEDHIRIQAFEDGFKLKEAWEKASNIDDIIEQSLDYAFDKKFGYLTSCPTNVGTGLRASVMIHLPFLTANGLLGKIANSFSNIGIEIRGYYGEGTKPIGSIYQISNQTTIGESEEEIIRKIQAIVEQIIYKEQFYRRKTIREKGIQIEDKIFRSLGIIKNSRLLSLKESIDILSYLRIGILIGLLNINKEDVDKLFIMTQPANIQKKLSGELNELSIDKRRAEIFRNILKEWEV